MIDNGRLKGKVALVTGAARGIGAAASRRLAEDGATVFLTDVLDPEGKDVAENLVGGGHGAFYLHLDVSDEMAWQAAVDRAATEAGRLDILVNNAGIGTFPDVEQETREGWDRLIATRRGCGWG